MSINVTVKGNPVRIHHGKMVTADTDYATKEFDKRRRIRLEQVRQQSKEIAEDIRNKVRRGKTKQLSKVEEEGATRLKKWQNKKLMQLQNQYDECLKDIGLGHLQAAVEEQNDDILNTRNELGKELAKERGRKAAQLLQVEKNQKNLEEAVPKQKRTLSRDVENTRASMVSKLHKTSKMQKKKKKQSKSDMSVNNEDMIELSDDTYSDLDIPILTNLCSTTASETDRISLSSPRKLPRRHSPSISSPTELSVLSEYSTKATSPVKTGKGAGEDYGGALGAFNSAVRTSNNAVRISNSAVKNSNNANRTSNSVIKTSNDAVKTGNGASKNSKDEEQKTDSATKLTSSSNFGLDTRISDRIKHRTLRSSEYSIYERPPGENRQIILSKDSSNNMETKIDSTYKPSHDKILTSTKHGESSSKHTGLGTKLGRSGTNLAGSESNSRVYFMEDAKKHPDKYCGLSGYPCTADVPPSRDIPYKPTVFLKPIREEPELTAGPSGITSREKVQYYDHPNRFSKEYLPDANIIRKISQDSIEVCPSDRNETEYCQQIYRRDQEALIRGQKALEKDKIHRDYQELLLKLPVLQRQERVASIDPSKDVNHMSEDRLNDVQKKFQIRMENAYERSFPRPQVITIPKVNHVVSEGGTSPYRTIDIDGDPPTLNIASWDMNIWPRNEHNTNESANQTESLTALLEKLKAQKECLLREVDQLPKNSNLQQLLADITLLENQQKKSNGRERTSTKGESSKDHIRKSQKRKHDSMENSECTNTSISTSGSRSLRDHHKDRSKHYSKSDKEMKQKHKAAKQSSSSTVPSSDELNKKLKKRYNVLVLQNMSTQTSPKSPLQDTGAQSLPSSRKGGEGRSKEDSEKMLTPKERPERILHKQTSPDKLCQCDEQIKENVCEILIKIKEDSSPVIKVTPNPEPLKLNVATQSDRRVSISTKNILTDHEEKILTDNQGEFLSDSHGNILTEPKLNPKLNKRDKEITQHIQRGKRISEKLNPTSMGEMLTAIEIDEPSTSTSYYSPPDFSALQKSPKTKTNETSRLTKSPRETTYSDWLREKPQQSNLTIPTLYRSGSLGVHMLDPRLKVYIRKLLSMNRMTVEELSVTSESDVATPSSSIFENSMNTPVNQLSNIMKFFNLNPEDIKRILNETEESTAQTTLTSNVSSDKVQADKSSGSIIHFRDEAQRSFFREGQANLTQDSIPKISPLADVPSHRSVSGSEKTRASQKTRAVEKSKDPQKSKFSTKTSNFEKTRGDERIADSQKPTSSEKTKVKEKPIESDKDLDQTEGSVYHSIHTPPLPTLSAPHPTSTPLQDITRSNGSDTDPRLLSLSDYSSKKYPKILEKYSEIAENCHKRIKSLDKLIEKVRQEKREMLDSHSSESDKENSVTAYKELPSHLGKSNESPNASDAEQEELTRKLLNFDFDLMRKMGELKCLEKLADGCRKPSDLSSKASNQTVGDIDPELIERFQNLKNLYTDTKSKGSIGSSNDTQERSKDATDSHKDPKQQTANWLIVEPPKQVTPFVPFLLDIPRLPKLSTFTDVDNETSKQSTNIALLKHKRPPPAKALLVARKFNENISVVPHELSTIAEGDSVLSTKLPGRSHKEPTVLEVGSSKENKESSKEIQGSSQEYEGPSQEHKEPSQEHTRLVQVHQGSANWQKAEGQEGSSQLRGESTRFQKGNQSSVNDRKIAELRLSSSSNNTNPETSSTSKDITTDESVPDILTELIKSAKQYTVTDTISTQTKDSTKKISPIKSRSSSTRDLSKSGSLRQVDSSGSSLPKSDIETIESMLKSLGMGWAITTIRKTQQALAQTSSSSSLDISIKKQEVKMSECSTSSSEVSLQGYLRKEIITKISSTSSDSEILHLMKEFDNVSAIQGSGNSLENKNQRTSTPVLQSQSPSKSNSKLDAMVTGESDLSSIRLCNEEVFASLAGDSNGSTVLSNNDS